MTDQIISEENLSSLPSLIKQLAERLQLLHGEADLFASLPAAQMISLRLDRAMGRLGAPEDMRRPLHVALLGGTGVGKSELFNALIDQPNASPTSDDIRCFTVHPYIAATITDRPLIQISPELDPVIVESKVPGVILCDTPDIDGMMDKNWKVTRDLIEHCDVIVLVTMPDKRANFDVMREVRDWAVRKRWFFVLNKMDLYLENRQAIRADFEGQLQELGFTLDDRTRFLVSARHPDCDDFPPLREAIFRTRPEDQVALLRLDGFLGYALYALPPESISKIEAEVHTLEKKEGNPWLLLSETAKQLEKKEEELRLRVHQAYQDGLRTPEASDAFRLVVRETVWRHLGQRCGWLMPLPVWLRCRFSLLWTSLQVSRLAMGGIGPFRLIGAAATAVVSAVRGLLPLKQIATALGRPYRRQLDEVQTDVRMVFVSGGGRIGHFGGPVWAGPLPVTDGQGSAGTPPLAIPSPVRATARWPDHLLVSRR